MAQRSVPLNELRLLLQQAPAMVQVHPLSFAFLPEEVRVFERARGLIAELDAPTPQTETLLAALEIAPEFSHRLPAIHCDHDPFVPELNHILLPKISWVQRWVLQQSEVPKAIAERATGDCVVCILIDGLGLWDWKRFAIKQWHMDACFVDGVSITEHGMRRLVGDPPLALRLAEKGYERSFGFSYWERTENELTDLLFAGVTEGVRKVRSFDEALDALHRLPLEGAFVQIVRAGLDPLGHRFRDRPDVAATVRLLCEEVTALARLLAEQCLAAQIFLIADHGILWQHEHPLLLYEAGSGNIPPRYYEGIYSGEKVWRVSFAGSDYTLLTYPYIRRPLRQTEWGVHGGLSFEESFVPFVTIKVTQGGEEDDDEQQPP